MCLIIRLQGKRSARRLPVVYSVGSAEMYMNHFPNVQ